MIEKDYLRNALSDYQARATLERGKAKQEEERDNQVMRAYHQGRADAYDLVVIKLTYLSQES